MFLNHKEIIRTIIVILCLIIGLASIGCLWQTGLGDRTIVLKAKTEVTHAND